jgi:hypothetical protein
MNKSLFKRLFHIFLIGGLLLYVGIKKTNTPQFIYNLTLITGVVVFIVHSFIAYQKLINSQLPWVSLIHLFLIAPALIYVGYYQNKSRFLFYELLLLLGFSCIGYHGYYLLRNE